MGARSDPRAEYWIHAAARRAGSWAGSGCPARRGWTTGWKAVRPSSSTCAMRSKVPARRRRQSLPGAPHRREALRSASRTTRSRWRNAELRCPAGRR
eukprot:4589899-Prymnesium_polylepis.2